MLILTGAAGFISSCLLTALNKKGYEGNVLVVDAFSDPEKKGNWEHKPVYDTMHRDQFIPWFQQTSEKIDFVLHIGARTDTSLLDTEIFDTLNLAYSKQLWQICTQRQIPFLYASSAATYGSGENGFSDRHDLIPALRPLNPYAESKQQFDLWVLQQEETPPFWMGCKFFNVYGPNEYHKGRMASVIFHTYHQIRKTGKMKLFRSHRSEVPDGHQSRDFIYVMDVIDVILFAMQSNTFPSGIYNLGTGKARTFLDLATNTFHALDLQPSIEFIDTPLDIRDSYQYFTQADISKLRQAGYTPAFTSLEEGIFEYVREYLQKQRVF